MIGRMLRRNCVILGRCEPHLFSLQRVTLVYVLTSRVNNSASKSVGTSRDKKLTKIHFIHPTFA